MPADPHHPQVGNLQISANAKTFGKQATRQHEGHRKDVGYSHPRRGLLHTPVQVEAPP